MARARSASDGFFQNRRWTPAGGGVTLTRLTGVGWHTQAKRRYLLTDKRPGR